MEAYYLGKGGRITASYKPDREKARVTNQGGTFDIQASVVPTSYIYVIDCGLYADS